MSDRPTIDPVELAAAPILCPSVIPGDPGRYSAVIVKRVDARTRAKTSINELLRT